MNTSFLVRGCLLLAAGTLFGCSPSSRAPRKKLPELTNESWSICPSSNNRLNNNEDRAALPSFGIDRTTIEGKKFYSVQIADANYDAAVDKLIEDYSVFAAGLIGMFLDNGTEGAVIDFRNASGYSSERAEYAVKNPAGQSISVVFMWDQLSAARATKYMNWLKQLTGIESSLTSTDKNF